MAEPAGRNARLVMATLWPAFVGAGVLEMLVFALVDPAQLHWAAGAAIEWPAGAIYTLAFFAFWAVVAASGYVTATLLDGATPGAAGGLSSSRR